MTLQINLNSRIDTLIQELQIPEKERIKVKEKINFILESSHWQIAMNMHHDFTVTWWRAKYTPRFESIANMVYRDFVWIHEQRVQMLSMQWSLEYVRHHFKNIRPQYLNLYAWIHDILEWISPFWDIPTPIKLALSPESNALLDEIEWKLGEVLFKIRPPLNQEKYSPELLRDMLGKESIESKVTSYLDKLDGFMVVFHELVAWNRDFLVPFRNYINIFQDIKNWKKLPELQELFSGQDSFLQSLEFTRQQKTPEVYESQKSSCHLFDIDSILKQAHWIEDVIWRYPTTEAMRESFDDDAWFPAYGTWKQSAKHVMFQTNPNNWGFDKILIQRGRMPNIPHQFLPTT